MTDNIIPFDKGRIPDHEFLLELSRARMPYGKYKGLLLIDLPEPYVVWICQKELPKGTLGTMLEFIYEIKLNGLEYLFDPLREDDERDF